jgi:hypothetical protein
LYTLDSQVQHHDSESLLGFGKWLTHRYNRTVVRRKEADTEMRKSELSATFLRLQLEEQVKSQTKPLPRMCIELNWDDNFANIFTRPIYQ